MDGVEIEGEEPVSSVEEFAGRLSVYAIVKAIVRCYSPIILFWVGDASTFGGVLHTLGVMPGGAEYRAGVAFPREERRE